MISLSSRKAYVLPNNNIITELFFFNDNYVLIIYRRTGRAVCCTCNECLTNSGYNQINAIQFQLFI